MRTTVLLVVVLLLVGCTSIQPVAIRAGDVCESCRRPILNANMAAEVIQSNGVALKFRTVGCMTRFLRQSASQPAAVYVTDLHSGRLIPAESAMFVRGPVETGSTEMDYAAFGSRKPAVEFGKAKGESPVDWLNIQKRVSAGATN